jgi:hypothetical protein
VGDGLPDHRRPHRRRLGACPLLRMARRRLRQPASARCDGAVRRHDEPGCPPRASPARRRSREPLPRDRPSRPRRRVHGRLADGRAGSVGRQASCPRVGSLAADPHRSHDARLANGSRFPAKDSRACSLLGSVRAGYYAESAVSAWSILLRAARWLGQLEHSERDLQARDRCRGCVGEPHSTLAANRRRERIATAARPRLDPCRSARVVVRTTQPGSGSAGIAALRSSTPSHRARSGRPSRSSSRT